MLDTITFVLHNVNEKVIDLNSTKGIKYRHGFNRALYERLCEMESKYITREVKFHHENTIENDNDDYFLSKVKKRIGFVSRQGSIRETLNKNEFYFFPVRGDFETASSEYRTRFSVSENSDSITFELSIPKMIYNNNIAQFVPNVETKRFKNNPFNIREWFGQSRFLMERLHTFILSFFNELCDFLSMPVMLSELDLSNIEIKRLDFCCNQFFPCHASVLDYLNGQRKVLKKVLTIKSKVDHYETSFAYRHADEGFYFKVYSKGEEFKANDLQKIFKQNRTHFDQNTAQLMPICSGIFKRFFPELAKKNLGKVEDLIFSEYKLSVESQSNQIFVAELENHLKHKLNFLYQEANKILRYEMSFNRAYMSVLYKKQVFRKKCENWKVLETAWKRVKQYNLYLDKGHITKANDYKLKFLLTKKEFQFHNIYDKSIHKKHEFMMLTNDNVKLHERMSHKDGYKITSLNYKAIHEMKEATFSNDLLKIMFNRFQKEVEALQLKKFDETFNILEAIDEYNEKAKNNIKRYKELWGEKKFKDLKHTEKRKRHLRQLNKPRLKTVLDKMGEGMSFDNIIETSGISKSSKYELQADLEVFNIFKSTIKTKFNHSTIRTDFRVYYQKFREDPHYHRKLFPNPYLVAFDDNWFTVRHLTQTA